MARFLRVIVIGALAAVGLAVLPATPTHAGPAIDRRAAAPELLANHAVYEPESLLVFASISDRDDTYPDHVIAFYPGSGLIALAAEVGDDPGHLELAPDGSSLYVALRDANEVVQLSTADLSVLRRFDLGINDDNNEFRASDMVALRGDDERVVIAKHVFGNDETLTVFVNGVALPDEEDSSSSSHTIAVVDENTIVGGGHFVRVFDVDDQGIRYVENRGDVVDGDIGIHFEDGIVFGPHGRSADFATGAERPLYGEGSSHSFAVFDGNYYRTDYRGSRHYIEAYDLTTGARVGEPVEIRSRSDGFIVTPSGLVAWDDYGLMGAGYFTAYGQVTEEGSSSTGIEEICVDAYFSDRDPLTLANQVATDANGHWEMKLTPGHYYFYFWDCSPTTRWFSEWAFHTLPSKFDDAYEIGGGLDGLREIPASLDPVFIDVPRDAYYADPVTFLRDTAITTGTSATTYSPDRFVTREQMGAFIGRFLEWTGVTCGRVTERFTDVPFDSFAGYHILCIADLGITTGTTPTTYSPANLVTREQMAAFLGRIWRFYDLECPAGDHPFTDVSPRSFAQTDIACIFQLGITLGTSPTTYGPDDAVTRGQMAAFLFRLAEAIIEAVD